MFYSVSSLSYAPSEGNITSYFGPYLYKTNFSSSKSGANSSQMAGIGLVVNGDINNKASLEIGFFHLNKTYFREEQQSLIGEQTALIHITMGYRQWFSEYFSGSLSLASGYSMGSVKTVYSDFVQGTEVDTSARDTTEYGFDLALQSELYRHPSYAVVLDARYYLSVTNKKNENADHYGVMLGLQHIYQEKNKKSNY